MARLLLLLGAALGLYLSLVGPERRARLWAAPWLRTVLALAFVLVYLRTPIDLIPDGSAVGFLDDLLLAVASLWWATYRTRPAGTTDSGRRAGESATRAGNPPSWDPYAVLDVRRGASQEEISAAYRERMKQYHPDRVSGLGDELQHLAHEKTLAIQRAYEELRQRR